MHKLTIRSRSPGQALTGANTELLIDGQKLKGVKKISFEITARDVAVFTIEMFADLDFEAEIGKLEINKVNR